MVVTVIVVVQAVQGATVENVELFMDTGGAKRAEVPCLLGSSSGHRLLDEVGDRTTDSAAHAFHALCDYFVADETRKLIAYNLTDHVEEDTTEYDSLWLLALHERDLLRL